MSNPPSPMQVFESSLGASFSLADNSDHERVVQVEALIRETLHVAQRMVPATGQGRSDARQAPATDLWDDIGAFMLRTSAIMTEFTARIKDADLVQQAAKEKFRKAREHDHLTERSVLQSLDAKKKMIEKTSELSAQYHKELQAIWNPKDLVRPAGAGLPKPSVSPYQDGQEFGNNTSSRGQSRRTLPAVSQLDQRSPNDQVSGSEASDDSDDEVFQAIDMSALANRGKGSHHCPKGIACNKGGVDRDGNLVAFERNSSFVQHCNKHRKPFRCTEDNCPNPPKKRRFARKDGLERHKSTVSHVPSSPGLPRAPKQTSVKIEST